MKNYNKKKLPKFMDTQIWQNTLYCTLMITQTRRRKRKLQEQETKNPK